MRLQAPTALESRATPASHWLRLQRLKFQDRAQEWHHTPKASRNSLHLNPHRFPIRLQKCQTCQVRHPISLNFFWKPYNSSYIDGPHGHAFVTQAHLGSRLKKVSSGLWDATRKHACGASRSLRNHIAKLYSRPLASALPGISRP